MVITNCDFYNLPYRRYACRNRLGEPIGFGHDIRQDDPWWLSILRWAAKL